MHDLHIHTKLSRCAGPDSEPAGYIEELRRRSFTVAGFADHLWDSDVPGASDWYRPQNVPHVLSLRRELAGVMIPGTRLLFGCETEYIGNGVVGLTPEHAALFDFVLVPASHIHMEGFVRPEGMTQSADLRKLLIDRFLEVCGIDFAFGIPHPFVPVGFDDRAEELLAGIPDHLFEECFRAAAETHKSVELNLSIFRKLPAAALREYERLMTIARECGCRFHIGSDAHGLCRFGEELFRAGEEFAALCGIRIPQNPLQEKEEEET